MKPRLALRSVEQVRALADPLRLRIVEALVPQERAALDLARLVGVPVTRVYHHLDLLLEAGLIDVVRRVPRRGMEERIFRASARRYVLADDLFGNDAAAGATSASFEELARTVLVGGFESLVEGLRTGRVDPGVASRGVLLQNRMLRITPAGFEALTRELPAWLDDFARRHRAAGSGGFRLALALFPGEGTETSVEPAIEGDATGPRRTRRPRR
ncbi:MAG: winged helix-turn-helix transcriptional regulator [Gemmatimonadales bacterium]|nr:winged helix-turn-helix transcriptional regulator [Gemmatimonadales bacterium]